MYQLYTVYVNNNQLYRIVWIEKKNKKGKRSIVWNPFTCIKNVDTISIKGGRHVATSHFNFEGNKIEKLIHAIV